MVFSRFYLHHGFSLIHIMLFLQILQHNLSTRSSFLCYLSVWINGSVLIYGTPCIIVSPESVLTPTPVDIDLSGGYGQLLAYNFKDLGNVWYTIFVETLGFFS